MSVLNTGDRFPDVAIDPVGAESLRLPGAMAGSYGVVLFYRGSWCVYCNGQLRSFQKSLEKLTEVGAKVVAVSVDNEATARETVRKLGLTFPVGHSAEPYHLAYSTGAFVHEDPVYLESTGFVLDPEGRVLVSVYSNNAIGRLTPEDVIGLIQYTKKQAGV